METLASMLRDIVPGKSPVMAVHMDRVRYPLATTAPIASFPLTADDWLALLTGRLLLIRLVDLSVTDRCYTLDGADVLLTVDDLASATPLLAKVRGRDYHLGFRFLEMILYGLHPIAEVARESAGLAARAREIVDLDGDPDVDKRLSAVSSTGPTVTYTMRIVQHSE